MLQILFFITFQWSLFEYKTEAQNLVQNTWGMVLVFSELRHLDGGRERVQHLFGSRDNLLFPAEFKGTLCNQTSTLTQQNLEIVTPYATGLDHK